MTKKRIEQIKKELIGLENSDERLYSNGNGNLPRYNALKEELAVLSRKYQRVKVRCKETGVVYDSAAAAANAIGCGKSAMANHLSGRFPHIRGLHFERTAVPSHELTKEE